MKKPIATEDAKVAEVTEVAEAPMVAFPDELATALNFLYRLTDSAEGSDRMKQAQSEAKAWLAGK